MVLLSLVMVTSLYLCACGSESAQANGNGAGKSKIKFESIENAPVQTVEITLDNLYDYFEDKEVVSLSYNAFDEPQYFTINQLLAPKEGYQVDADASDIAIEFSKHAEEYYVSVDYDTLQYTYEEKIKDGGEYTGTASFQNNTYCIGAVRQQIYGWNYSALGDYYITVDSKTQRKQNTKYFVDEIVRVKGTLCVAETGQLDSYYDTEKYAGTPRLSKIMVVVNDVSRNFAHLSESGNITFNTAANKRMETGKKYYCIIVDNDTPEDFSDDVIAVMFCE